MNFEAGERNGRYFFRITVPAHLNVLQYPLGRYGFGQNDEALLQPPPQEQLRRGLVIAVRDLQRTG